MENITTALQEHTPDRVTALQKSADVNAKTKGDDTTVY
jgi:hypothetical protein